ncbi:hypothetical protein SPAR166_1287 [Streptococcus pneumoniae GA60132]|nr:hypothetical protein SPAR166_1287 [Streptococcus pneumoniae GA60132]
MVPLLFTISKILVNFSCLSILSPRFLLLSYHKLAHHSNTKTTK